MSLIDFFDSFNSKERIFGIPRPLFFFIAQFVAFLMMVIGFAVFVWMWYSGQVG